MFKAKGMPRILIGDTIATDEGDEGDVTTVTMTMNGAEVEIDFSKDWNIMGYTAADLAVGDYVVSYQTDETSDIATAEWMLIPAEVFEAAYVIEGA